MESSGIGTLLWKVQHSKFTEIKLSCFVIDFSCFNWIGEIAQMNQLAFYSDMGDVFPISRMPAYSFESFRSSIPTILLSCCKAKIVTLTIQTVPIFMIDFTLNADPGCNNLV